MKNDTLKYILGGILLGGIAVWFITMSAINSSNTGMMRMIGLRISTQQGTTQVSNTIDAHFIEQMIPHHEDAITMAKLALLKAKRPEVKQLAENIIDSQGKEINQMKIWYKSWYGKEVPQDERVMGGHGMGQSTIMHMGMMGDATDMTRLEQATDFDKTFVEEMIPHHQMAVMMASMLKGATQRLEMKELADNIITAQTNEIDQMRQWYKN